MVTYLAWRFITWQCDFDVFIATVKDTILDIKSIITFAIFSLANKYLLWKEEIALLFYSTIALFWALCFKSPIYYL